MKLEKKKCQTTTTKLHASTICQIADVKLASLNNLIDIL